MNQDIKINKITILKAIIPLKKPFKIALGIIENAESVFVKINTDKGIYGIGESAPFHAVTGETQQIAAAAGTTIGKMLLGKNPLGINANLQDINKYLTFNSAIKCGFDMALYDIAGKVADLPIYALLGGSRQPLITDLTIGINTPKIMVEDALAVKNSGFSAIKVKLGEGCEPDVERIKKIREAIGPDMKIRVDANQGWDYPTAVSAIEKMLPYELEYCEQPLPVWDYENMRRLREKSVTPIAADESIFNDKDAFKLASSGACDILNIKLAKSGGIHTAVKIDNIAQSAGIPCMLGCMSETRLGLTAAAHFASAHPNVKYLDLDGHTFLGLDPVINGIICKGENVSLPDAPGLGADLDPEFLKNCETIIIN